MKLSENTMNVLKNFSSINDGLVLQKGTKQRTMAPDQTVLIEAILSDDFPEQFGIYELNKFLGNITTLNDPDLTFTGNSVMMEDSDIKLNWYSCSPSLIVSPPDKELVMKNIDITFDLSADLLKKILRLSLMNNLSNITLLGKNGELRLQTHERKNDTSNFAFTKIAKHDGADFTVSFKADKFKMIPDDYRVEVSIGTFAKFTNKSGNLIYYIAQETK